MDDMICNANVYSAFLEGKATKDEMRTILKKMMRDSRLMMKLNLAAAVSSRKKKDEKIVRQYDTRGTIRTYERVESIRQKA